MIGTHVADVLCEVKQHQSLVTAAWQNVSDGESYVRAAALKCVLNASSVPSVWNDFTSTMPQVNVELFHCTRGPLHSMK